MKGSLLDDPLRHLRAGRQTELAEYAVDVVNSQLYGNAEVFGNPGVCHPSRDQDCELERCQGGR